MSSVMPFFFNAVEFCDLTINDKPWIRGKEVCKALRCEKVARRTVRHHCTRENIQHKHQLAVVRAEGTTVNWPSDSEKLDLYINEEGIYELQFSSQQPKAKDFRKYCCNVLFPHVRQQLTCKMQEDHQEAIKEKDAALAHRDNQIQTIQYENVGLQGKIRAKNQQIAALQKRCVGHLSNEDKNNVISIITKNNEEAEYPYISICGIHGYRRHKARVLLARNESSTLFADGDTPNAIVMCKFWREHTLIVVDARPRHFRLDMMRAFKDESFSTGILSISISVDKSLLSIGKLYIKGTYSLVYPPEILLAPLQTETT